MKTGTASEKAYDKSFKEAQENPHSEQHQETLKEAKEDGGPEGRATVKGSNHAQGKN